MDLSLILFGYILVSILLIFGIFIELVEKLRSLLW